MDKFSKIQKSTNFEYIRLPKERVCRKAIKCSIWCEFPRNPKIVRDGVQHFKTFKINDSADFKAS